jgi:hypothetical protein
MATELHQTQRGHFISEMVVSFILFSLIVLPILALLLIMGLRFY